MTDLFKDIREFHENFGLSHDQGPRHLNDDMQEFRILFMREELIEYIDACVMGDQAKQLDALVDLAYVVLGTAYLHGFPFNEAWAEVHLANMRKIRAMKSEESKRGSSYDIVKPAGWVGPDIEGVLAAAQRASRDSSQPGEEGDGHREV
jgi:predicted HAD superfamily Cof-like phosphohydrolase